MEGYPPEGVTVATERRNYWQRRYGFTEAPFVAMPITSHGIAGCVYTNATDNGYAEEPSESWVPEYSVPPSVTEDVASGRVYRDYAAFGPGNYTYAAASINMADLYTEVNGTPGTVEDFSLGVFAASLGGVMEADGRFGLGSRGVSTPYIIRGWELRLDASVDTDDSNPDLRIEPKDETGAVGSGKLYLESVVALPEQAAADTPPSGYGFMYAKTDGLLYWKDDGGTEYDLTGSGGAHMPYADLQPDGGTVQNIGGANGTTTAITWDAQEYVDTDWFAHNTLTNPSRVTVVNTGRYEIKANVGWDTTGGARSNMEIGHSVNGGAVSLRGVNRGYTRGNNYGQGSCNLNTEVELTAGDYIEIIMGVNDTDGVYTINTVPDECEFIIRRIAD